MKKQILFITVVTIIFLIQNILYSQVERSPDMKFYANASPKVGEDGTKDDGTFYLLPNPLNSFISSISPVQNAVNINKSSDINVVFTQNMNASTINGSNIKTFGLQTGMLSSSVSYNAGIRTVTINPAGNFKMGEKIQVTLSSGIQTSSNTPITPFTWTFTVQAMTGTSVFTNVAVDTVINVRSFVTGDFDNDGDLDIITLNTDSNNFSVYKNGQQANFTKTSTLQLNISSKSIIGGDMDNDGDLDIAIAGYNELTIYKNNGSAIFSEDFGMTLPGGNTLTGFADAGDLDSDGDIDIFWGAISEGSFEVPMGFVFLNNGDGSFNNPQSISFGVSFMGCSGGNYPADLVKIEIVDFDNDGDLDVAASALQERDCIGTTQDIYFPFIRILFNNGNSQFSSAPYISLDSISPLTTGNFDNDEDADIISNNLLLRNNNTGIFTSSLNDINGSLLISSDFDADGDLDIAAAKNPNKLFLHKNTGNATFTLPTDLNLNNNPLALESGDFDGDGDLDIVVLSGSGTGLSILINAANTITCSIFSIIEGFYDVNLNKLNIRDTVRAYLRNVNAPYNFVDSAKAVIDSVLFNGIFTFMNASTGTYYIVTKHRNGLETWSKSGGENITAGGLYTYDFTSSQSQAYGNNLIQKGSKYCLYSGDLDGDGVTDLDDILGIYNDALNFATGYIISDLNGNNAADLGDLLIVYNNSKNFVRLKRP